MRRFVRWSLAGAAAVLVGGVAMIAAWGRGAESAQQPPPLASEDLLRLVLPLDAAGRRPGVIAWARLDSVSGTPEAFVTVLYETPAPFGGMDLRRLVNRVRWTGSAYEAVEQNQPGEVLDGEAVWLGAPGWSVTIDASNNQSAGDPIYTVTYAGSGPLDDGSPAKLTLTELFRPSGALMWRRITESQFPGAPSPSGPTTRTVSVRYRISAMPNEPDRLIAEVAEATEAAAAPGGGAQPAVLRRFTETYVLRNDRFELETRTITRIP